MGRWEGEAALADAHAERDTARTLYEDALSRYTALLARTEAAEAQNERLREENAAMRAALEEVAAIFPGHLIGRGGPSPCPARACRAIAQDVLAALALPAQPQPEGR